MLIEDHHPVSRVGKNEMTKQPCGKGCSRCYDSYDSYVTMFSFFWMLVIGCEHDMTQN